MPRNLKKFFGIKIDDCYPADICDSVDPIICLEHDCGNKCPIFHSWERKYKKYDRGEK